MSGLYNYFAGAQVRNLGAISDLPLPSASSSSCTSQFLGSRNLSPIHPHSSHLDSSHIPTSLSGSLQSVLSSVVRKLRIKKQVLFKPLTWLSMILEWYPKPLIRLISLPLIWALYFLLHTPKHYTHTHTHTHTHTSLPHAQTWPTPLRYTSSKKTSLIRPLGISQSCLAPAPWLSLSFIITISLLISLSVFPPDWKLLRVRTMSCSWLSLPGPVNCLVQSAQKQIDEFPSLTFIRLLYFNT